MGRVATNSLFVILLCFLWSGEATAKNFDWLFQNKTGRTLNVELYGKSRNNIWPGNGIVWILPPDGRRYANRISCKSGEYICYGAWAADKEGLYWGAGKGGNEACSNCCYYCRGRSTQIIGLLPGAAPPPTARANPAPAQPPPDTTARPSFNCTTANLPAEQAICRDPQLAELDRKIAATYAEVLESTPKRAAEEIRAGQREFLRTRNQCRARSLCLSLQLRIRLTILTGLLTAATASRDSAPRSGISRTQSCRDAMRQAKAVAARVTLTMEKSSVDFGETFQALWTAREGQLSIPVNLVLEAPPASRFVGQPFTAFVKGTKSRYGLTGDGRDVAVVVPLDRVIGDGLLNGAIGVRLFREGQADLTWSVVSSGRCGNQVLRAPQTFRISVGAGQPQLVVQDRFDTGRPKRIIRSNDGRYDLLIYDGRYEVHDAVTAVKLFEHEGTEPNFSPTGRFIASLTEDRNWGRPFLDVFDLVSGEMVLQAADGFLIWARDDSILLAARALEPGIRVLQTLIDKREFESLFQPKGTALNAQMQLVLNLEQGFVLDRSMRGEVAVNDLIYGKHLLAAAPEQTASLAQVNKLLVPFGLELDALPDRWRLGETIKMSHLGNSNFQADYGPAFADFVKLPEQQVGSWSGAKVITHQDITDGAPEVLAERSDGLRGHSVKGRGFGLSMPPAQIEQRTVLRRIADAGVALTEHLPVESWISEGPEITQAMRDSPDSMALIDAAWRRYDAEKPAWVARVSSLLEGVKGPILEAGYHDPGVDTLNAPGKLFLKDIIRVWHWRADATDLVLLRQQYTDGSAQVPYETIWLANLKDHSLTDISSETGWNITVAQITASGLLLVGSADGIGIIDLAKKKQVGPTFAVELGTLLKDLRLTKDGHHLLQVNSDGSFQLHEIPRAPADIAKSSAPVDPLEQPDQKAEKHIILAGQVIDDEVVVYRPDGTFDATYEGAYSIQFKFPGIPGLYSFNQFELMLKRPGLLARTLEGQTVPPAPKLPGAPPTAALELRGPPANGRLSGTIEAASTTSLKSVRIYADGRLVQDFPANGQHERTDFDIADPGAGRWLAAVAEDQHGLVSLPNALHVPGQTAAKGTLHGVMVGIDKYEDTAFDPLDFGSADAMRLKKALEGATTRSYESVDVAVLANEAATPQSVIEALDSAVSKSRPEDTLVFFFAGHGVDGGEAGFRMITAATDSANLKDTSLGWAEVGKVLARSTARVVVLLDACQSGFAGREFKTSNDSVVAQLLTNSGAPMVVLAAAKGREFSIEDPPTGGGLFTTAIVDVIGPARDKYDRDHNGLLDAGELYAGVRSLVLDRSTALAKTFPSLAPHTPWMARNALIGDFSLF